MTLAAGAHPVRVTFAGQDGPGGLEWVWTPPGGVPSIVPPDALAPPPGAGIGPALAPDALGPADLQPTDAGLSVIR